MKKLKKIQKIIGLLIIAIILVIIVYGILIIIPNKKNAKDISESIKYGYTLYKRDIKLYKDTFEKLKGVLEKDTINYNEYAKYASELFIIDFYTLNNKISKNDIGGIQFIHEDLKDNFIQKASDTVYKYINSESVKNELPEVSTIKSSVKEGKYKISDIEYDSYIVELNWDYIKDYGYEKNGIVTLVKVDDELFIVEKDNINEK